MRIGTLEVGGAAPVACIAEIGNAHNGDFSRAIRLLDAAKAANASAAKLQCYSVDELIALRGDGPAPAQWGEQGWSMRDLYTKAMTPREWFAPLYAHAASIELPIFSSVFGPESFALLESIGNPCYKLAALDCDATELRDLVLRTDKPVIRSHPADVAPTRWPLSLTLYAPSGYPQPRAKLGNIRNRYDGYSYHGTDPEVPVLAVVAGARVLEVHFQLDDEPSELEKSVSLSASEFRNMVNSVRRVEEMM